MPRTRYLLIWFSLDSIKPHTLIPIRRAIEDSVKEPPEDVEIDLWLESPGGDAHSSFKLALMLRHAASYVRVVVPDYAKSAATLLTLAGHEIFLAPGAELGPLDAQMPEEGSLAGYISALNIARAADEVARDAVALAGRGGADLLYQTGLSRAQTMEAMLRFSAEFSAPLVQQLDPKVVHHAKQMLRVTKQYAEKLLAVTAPDGDAGEIAASLVEDYPTHGYVICFEDALRLGLPVKPIDEYDLLDLARALHRGTEDDNESLIWFGEANELLRIGEEGDDDHEQAGTVPSSSDDGEVEKAGPDN